MTAADTRAPATTLVGRAQANVVFGTVALAVLMSALDQTIVSTALPTIIADLGGAGHMSWVVTSYLLSAAVATALAGKFGDLFGRKLIFQLSTAIFIAGSLVAGMAHGMSLLIVGRAIQGVGAGGLLVTSMALIADVIPLRERGKYQGGLGAVFGVATVVGPTLGGLFTDHASWRWCFYVNIPLALIMIIVAARAIPTMRAPAKPTIDYAGIGLIAVGVSCLILGLEWGGQEYAWGSATIVGLFVAAAVLVAAFVLVEQRAAEPMLPMRLFRGNVFAVCSILSFVVGFAMLGVLTYLPAYLQFVDGISATASGVRTLPLVAGLLVTSVISGQVAGKTGRYKIFPIAGTAVMAVGLLLMSTMGRGTSTLRESLYMLVLGLGLGLAMQVLTIVVQNTVPYTDLGTATAGVTFFRTIGGAFGTAIFGSLYASQLGPNLNAALAQVPEVPAAVAENPQLLRSLPLEQAYPIIDAYADSLDYVFRWVVPVAVIGFLVAWTLKQVPLRQSIRADVADVGSGFAMPDSADRAVRLEHSVASLWQKLRRDEVPDPLILAAAGSSLTRDQAWAIGQVRMLEQAHGQATLSAIARAHWMPPEALEPVYDKALRSGNVRIDGDRYSLTPAGQAEFDRIHAAWRDWLGGQLDDWNCTDPADRELLDQALDKIAAKLLDESEKTPS
ncbi:DHA2 family efflux MFS transporter permease subunit [Nocardia sp. NBC_00511]|uniref:MDR family MFS transporter n=1 Tax=Nocardia sp. NBC_00511 TaxID=2903591 RepID=UPI0030E0B199